ncbi:ROK family protein [Deinococcus hopiensis]|uniref:Glucokinase n=1 Tax=Deinococcus hopiensis KR-140 TaxID=695939 RepID=A0A1W1UAS7_9DEIO|nr:ROK family protein [Deinococcus hopiensis]SMB78177.1 glucokinase [Deinococcus hopiensis KR-140]
MFDSAAHAVTLDVGGSHVTAALVHLATRRIQRQARLEVSHAAPQDALLSAWTAAALEVWKDVSGRPSHLGLAVPGPFEHHAGVSRMTHKFPALLGVPLRPLLAHHVRETPLSGVPIYFGNDADLFALGEWWAGAGRGSLRMIGLTLGTGLGSGFIAGGRIITAGDEVPPGGELWNRPFRGAIAETFACGAALTRAWVALGHGPLTAHDLAHRALDGDASAHSVFHAFGCDLADILQPWVERFGAERVVLGGNVSRAFDLFAPALRSGLPSSEVRTSEHFELAAPFGAAALAGEEPQGVP